MVSDLKRRPIGVAQQIPRTSLALLMIAQLVVLAPLALYISPWVVAACLFCGFWRTQVYLGRWGFPGRVVKGFLVFAAFIAVSIELILQGGRTFSLEAASSLLALAFALKLVEMKNRRDAFLVIYLSYFMVATAFLFDQRITLAVYEVGAMIVVTAALIGLNQLQTSIRPLNSLWTATSLVIQALPLMVVLFLLFPRIEPLWSIPIPGQATTGLSDRLTPGDIANLSKSDELAFVVTFADDPPAHRDLYWRGLVYSNFANGTWSVAQREPAKEFPAEIDSVSTLSYKVLLEPTQSRWLYALDTPVSVSSPSINLQTDFGLLNDEPVFSLLPYEVSSATDAPRDLTLGEQRFALETQLPLDGDSPRMRAYGRALLEQTGGPEAMIQAMLADIRQQQFFYTLSPPQLPTANSVDAFWFDTRRGFCTHYAGAMVFALRAAGIPARMVGGYQGGEINPVSGHMVVRQYQAHSWVEAWLEGRGWTRFDPTAAVAPARVESGLDAALTGAERDNLSLLTAARMGGEGFYNNVLNFVESIEYQWNLWVVGYDAATQSSVLKDLLGDMRPWKIALAIAIGGGVSMLLVVVALFWRRGLVRRHPLETIMRNFAARNASLGMPREQAEPPASYLARVAARANMDGPRLADQLQLALYDPEYQMSWLQRYFFVRNLRKIQFKLALSTNRGSS